MAQSLVPRTYPENRTVIVTSAAIIGATGGFLHGGITGAIKGAAAGAILNYAVNEAMKHLPTVNAMN